MWYSVHHVGVPFRQFDLISSVENHLKEMVLFQNSFKILLKIGLQFEHIQGRTVQLPDYKPKKSGVPTGIRTPVSTVKGWCPRPLDDGNTLGESRWIRTIDPLVKSEVLYRLS